MRMQQIFKDSQGIPFCAFASVYSIPAASQFFSSDFGTFKDLTACKDSKKIKEHFSYRNSQKELLQDTSGLTVGDPLVKTGLPLSLELGPGILDGIYVSWRATVATTS